MGQHDAVHLPQQNLQQEQQTAQKAGNADGVGEILDRRGARGIVIGPFMVRYALDRYSLLCRSMQYHKM
jgi:hypothetical protein